jgi:hypothetical protein
VVVDAARDSPPCGLMGCPQEAIAAGVGTENRSTAPVVSISS